MVYLIHHLLSESTVFYADRIAIIDDDSQFTYLELEQLSNQLAWMLMDLGVDRGCRVGILGGKKVASIAALFGVLKVGAIYVPLDSSSPSSRLAYIVQDCGIKCMIAPTDKYEKVAEIVSEAGQFDLLVWHGIRKPIAFLERLAIQEVSLQQLDHYNVVAPPATGTIDVDPAYILYTSGSTGHPKGVVLSHLNSLTFIDWAHAQFGIREKDRLSNHAPLHFDLSVFDIFVSIKAGATVYLIPERKSLFPGQLAEFISVNRISVWYSVPSALTLLTLYGDLPNHDLSSLRLILFAGEVFPIKHLRPLMQYIPHAEYYNLYGPTETNVCTYYHVRELPCADITSIPIGKPCRNSDVFALDAEGRLVTNLDQQGELYVRGSSVMCGYWGQPQKTSEVLLPNPIWPYSMDRVYRTGDLVSIDDEGKFLFLGRRDHMVKSRGYRIELGEIEEAIYQHTSVKEAAALAVPDDLVGNRIYAFVVPYSESGQPLSKEIRRHCAARLPQYMIPEVQVLEGELPKTSTGKVDRQCLAALLRQRLSQ